MIQSEKKESNTQIQETNKQIIEDNKSSFIVIGSTNLITTMNLANIGPTYLTENIENFEKKLIQLKNDTVIITTNFWKDKIKQLNAFPFTITLPDNLNEISNMDNLRKQTSKLIGINIGGDKR